MEIAYGNRIAYLEAQAKLVDQQHELMVQRRRLVEITAARQAVERQREQAVEEYAHDILSDMADAEQKAADLAQDLVKAGQKMEEQVLRTPVDGTVQQLAVHTVGGVVTPAQQLMMIVPAESHFEVEAMVSNREIGFVNPGQEADIKVDTFNFTRYGLLLPRLDRARPAGRQGRPAEVARRAIRHERARRPGAALRSAGVA